PVPWRRDPPSPRPRLLGDQPVVAAFPALRHRSSDPPRRCPAHVELGLRDPARDRVEHRHPRALARRAHAVGRPRRTPHGRARRPPRGPPRPEPGSGRAGVGAARLLPPPRGRPLRALVAAPVGRGAPRRVVADGGARSQAGEVLSRVVTPEGTRGAGSDWKSGFYRIAREAHLPVTLGYVDRTTMTTGLGPTIELTGDVRADMDVVRAFYADKSGVRPTLR